jgi:hypothetical protein
MAGYQQAIKPNPNFDEASEMRREVKTARDQDEAVRSPNGSECC